MAAAAAAAGQPPPGLGPRGALAGRMRFPGQYFMWSSFFSWAIIPGVGFESFNNPRIGISKSLTTAQSKPVRSRPPSYQTHSWTKRQKPAKNVIEKIREIQWSYLCLQRFDKFWIWSKYNLRKWKLCEFTETCREKFVKSSWANLFLTSFGLLEPLWDTTQRNNSSMDKKTSRYYYYLLHDEKTQTTTLFSPLVIGTVYQIL